MFRKMKSCSSSAVIVTGLLVMMGAIYATAMPSPHMRPHQLRPATPINPQTAYPYGADNGESIWIDSASGPQAIVQVPIIATTATSPASQIAATSGKKVKLLGFFLTSSAAGTVQFQDEAGTPNKLTGVITLAANGQVFVPASKFGVFDSLSGAAVDLAVTGTSNTVGGYAVYALH